MLRFSVHSILNFSLQFLLISCFLWTLQSWQSHFLCTKIQQNNTKELERDSSWAPKTDSSNCMLQKSYSSKNKSSTTKTKQLKKVNSCTNQQIQIRITFGATYHFISESESVLATTTRNLFAWQDKLLQHTWLQTYSYCQVQLLE